MLFSTHAFARFAALLFGGLLILLGCTPLRAQTPEFGPAVVVGEPSATSSSVVTRTAVDALGNVYAAGHFRGTVQFGASTLTSSSPYDEDLFVTRLDGAGHCVWVAQGSSNNADAVGGLIVDASGAVYVSGYFDGATAMFGTIVLSNPSTRYTNADLFVARLDGKTGDWLWAVRAGGSMNDYAGPLASDGLGNVYVGGSFTSLLASFGPFTVANSDPNSANISDMFIGKLNAQGVWQWVQAGGGGGYDATFGLAVDAAHNVYLTGLVQSTDPRFGPLSLPPSVIYNADDILVAKLDAAGSWQWAARAGGTGTEEGFGIAVDDRGNAYVTGRFRSPTATFGTITLANSGAYADDAFVARLGPDGTWQWAIRAEAGSGNEYGRAIVFEAASNRLLVAGTFTSSAVRFGSTTLTNAGSGPPYSAEVFLAYLDVQGTWLGATGTQNPGNDYVSTMTSDGQGHVSLAGSFEGPTARFGATTLASSGTVTGYTTLVPTLATVAAIAPATAAAGQPVTLTGTGFVGVTAVLFNGVPTTAFTVESAGRMRVTVPAGATAGPVSVRSSAGTSSSTVLFQPLVLYTAMPAGQITALQVYPNPATVSVHLPGVAVGSSVQLLDATGRIVGTLVVEPGFVAALPAVVLPGLYMLRTTDDRSRARWARLVIQ